MSHAPGLAHSIPKLQTDGKVCSRCGKDFHLFRSKKNCHNCGSLVCEACSNYKTKLPQFGYNIEVRCCKYCAHFLQVSKMDYARLSELNIKTLRGYLLSYNISTQGMLEKQDLIRAIQSYKPIPEASEKYYRAHLPATPEKSSNMFEELIGLGKSESPSGSSQGSSSTGSDDGWSWDIDKFFSKLFGAEDRDSTPRTTRPNRSQSQSQPQQQQRPQQQQQQQQQQPRPQYSSQSQNWSETFGTTFTANMGPSATFQPPPGNPPQFPYNPNTFTPPPNPPIPNTRPQTQYTGASRTTSSTNGTSPRPRTQNPPPSQSRASPANTITLDQLVTSNTDPSTLSIKAIKSILDDSCVSYVGIVEKRDLVDRLEKLINNTKAERQMVQESEGTSALKTSPESAKSPSGTGGNDDENLCKICCDAALNCVMLNCNHMSTCMDCGKLIMEGSRVCPICREYVVRLLHVFRA